MHIATINSIEVSSLCDNACEYCPCKEQGNHRLVGLMPVEVFQKAIEWVSYFCKKGTQLELNLFGVGEPTLHPKIVEMVAYARAMLPFKQLLHLNTNGNRMTEDLALKLMDAGISQIDITGHDHRATAKTIKIFQKVGIKFNISYDFVFHPNNWAGQVPDWFAADYNLGDCPWLSRGQAMVMSDGSLTTCCIDAFGKNVFGTIHDDLSTMEINESNLCGKCHHTVPQRGRLLYAV